MVQNKIRIGRPLAFDRDTALEAVMNLFWDRGYHNVGLSDLEAQTRLNRSSLYNSFGSKDVLFTMALNHYTEHLANKMFAALESGSGGMADIESFLKQLAKHLKTQTGRGCFMVNTMAGVPSFVSGDSDLAQWYITSFLKAVRAALERAALRGEIASTAVNSGAEMLLGVVLGANLLARANQPQQLIEEVLDSAFFTLIRAQQDATADAQKRAAELRR